MGQKQTKLTRTTVEDLAGAWVVEHPFWWLGAALLTGAILGALCMEMQLFHAGLL